MTNLSGLPSLSFLSVVKCTSMQLCCLNNLKQYSSVCCWYYGRELWNKELFDSRMRLSLYLSTRLSCKCVLHYLNFTYYIIINFLFQKLKCIAVLLLYLTFAWLSVQDKWPLFSVFTSLFVLQGNSEASLWHHEDSDHLQGLLWM